MLRTLFNYLNFLILIWCLLGSPKSESSRQFDLFIWIGLSSVLTCFLLTGFLLAWIRRSAVHLDSSLFTFIVAFRWTSLTFALISCSSDDQVTFSVDVLPCVQHNCTAKLGSPHDCMAEYRSSCKRLPPTVSRPCIQWTSVSLHHCALSRLKSKCY